MLSPVKSPPALTHPVGFTRWNRRLLASRKWWLFSGRDWRMTRPCSVRLKECSMSSSGNWDLPGLFIHLHNVNWAGPMKQGRHCRAVTAGLSLQGRHCRASLLPGWSTADSVSVLAPCWKVLLYRVHLVTRGLFQKRIFTQRSQFWESGESQFCVNLLLPHKNTKRQPLPVETLGLKAKWNQADFQTVSP